MLNIKFSSFLVALSIKSKQWVSAQYEGTQLDPEAQQHELHPVCRDGL